MEEINLNETLSYRILVGIQLYYTPALVTLGSLGNSLSVLVFFTTKLRKLSSSYYLSALAISDTGFLLITFPSWLGMFDDVTWFNQPGFCEFSVYMTQVCSFLSVWFIVAFTVERFIAVRYPLKRPSMCTVSRAKAVLLCLSLFALISYTPYIFISGVSKQNGSDIETCGPRRELMGIATTLNHVDVVFTLLIPFLAIVILNALISRTVYKVARVRRSMTKSSGGGGSHKSRTSSSQTKVTEMLLVVSTVFICLNLPSYVMRVWVYLSESLNLGEEQNINMIILQQYFQLLFLTNFGINFALYCVSGQNFRKALISIFKPDLLRRAETTQITVSEYCRTASTRRTKTVNGSWRETHELVPINRPMN
ncbi:galanin-like G-protein coupled receptor npr-9 isoform X2 [Cimex lectularius]|uniref:G-protein coupled receptors family 1 profile domain-containing protein n=1 Tax=Cimex lectularius TaxID=79782 RepID=A0A8I6SJE1_CIMLE|nr:galanin-like G-protein coupled receptor npr-9 isoform X2 [Cimex lectularius]